jgi:hypothetical protein
MVPEGTCSTIEAVDCSRSESRYVETIKQDRTVWRSGAVQSINSKRRLAWARERWRIENKRCEAGRAAWAISRNAGA